MSGDESLKLGEFSNSVSVSISYKLRCDHLFTSAEIDKFVELYENPKVSELEIQKFLADHTKFLFLLGLYDVAIPQPNFLSTLEEIDGSRRQLRLDFLLKETRGPWDVVELKKPKPTSGSLVVGPPARRRFSSEVQDALAQVRTYLDELSKESAQRDLNARGIHILNPIAWLIVGKDQSLPLFERRRLERDIPTNIKLITYDEIAGLAQRRVIVTPFSYLTAVGIRIEQREDGLHQFYGKSRQYLSRAAWIRDRISNRHEIQHIIELLVKPVEFLERAWEAWDDPDDGEDRIFAAAMREEFSSYITELQTNWDCEDLGRFMVRKGGPQTWGMQFDFSGLISAVERQIKT